jgi:hypothetical protein
MEAEEEEVASPLVPCPKIAHHFVEQRVHLRLGQGHDAGDAQLDGLFRCIQAHLAPGGTCILNVAMPKAGPEELCRTWASEAERFCWETLVEGGRVICHERRRHIQVDPLVLYPELIWRRYAGDAMVDEVELRIPMRYHDPDEFSGLIQGHGFSILNHWGGYSGEEYGRGSELIVQFQCRA